MQPLLDADLLQGFRDEIESCLPAIRAAADDPNRRAEAQSLAHGVRGAASIMGLQTLAAEAGALESALRQAIAAERSDSTGPAAAIKRLEAAVHEALGSCRSAPTPAAISPQAVLNPAEAWTSDHESVPDDLLPTFREEAEELLASIADALRSLRGAPEASSPPETLRRHLHTLKGAAGMAGLRNASKLAHRLEDCLESWEPSRIDLLQAGADLLEELCVPGSRSPELRRRALALHNAIATTTASPVSALAAALESEQSDATSSQPRPAASSKLFRTPVERIDELLRLAGERVIVHTALQAVQDRWAKELHAFGAVSRQLRRLAEQLAQSAETPVASGTATRARPRAVPGPSTGFDELELDRYSELSLLAGDLSEAAAEIAAAGTRMEKLRADLNQGLREIGRLHAQSRDRLMQLRMAPLSSLRRRLERTARATAEACGKQTELVLDGDVELDKSVLDAVVGPLEHLLRNAVDHGLEAPAERLRRCKLPMGRIRISARLEGVQAVIELADDGAGFNLEKLHEQALRADLVKPGDEPLNPEELHRLAFLPGMTTTAEVSEISGRGVGLDAVRSAVISLGGSLSVRSTPGAGAVFVLRLPTSLVAARVLLVEAADQTFAVPLYSVTRVLRVAADEIDHRAGSPYLRVDGEALPLVSLNEALGLTGAPAAASFPALALSAAEGRYVLAVDRLLESRDAVIKSLGPLLANVPGFRGATLLADGAVCLVLNPASLLTAARPAQPASASRAALRILLVDDSPSVRAAAAKVLEGQGWNVHTSRDGQEALTSLARLAAAGEPPDALLLDVEMPVMDGYELTAALRASRSYSRLPIVMLTSRAGDKHRRRALELGANDYLVKPFDPARLVAALSAAVEAAVEDPQ
jgi:chemosensory pili system protein ChpA (sensor histidine kinase/response regulator)